MTFECEILPSPIETLLKYFYCGYADSKSNIFAYNLAGHETTANTVAYALVLLAAHPQYQDWVREEIMQVQDTLAGDYNSIFPRLQRCLAVMVSQSFQVAKPPSTDDISMRHSASTAPLCLYLVLLAMKARS